MRRSVCLKRAYERPDLSDGMRVLVDRVWPRRASREDLKIDLWLKEVAPSTALRKWFGHGPEKWEEMGTRYRRELGSGSQKEAFERLKSLYQKGRMTLVYGAKDEQHNQAVILKELLEDRS